MVANHACYVADAVYALKKLPAIIESCCQIKTGRTLRSEKHLARHTEQFTHRGKVVATQPKHQGVGSPKSRSRPTTQSFVQRTFFTKFGCFLHRLRQLLISNYSRRGIHDERVEADKITYPGELDFAHLPDDFASFEKRRCVAAHITNLDHYIAVLFCTDDLLRLPVGDEHRFFH